MSEEIKCIEITGYCPQCGFKETHEFDFRGAVSGEIKFACSKCGFQNSLSMKEVEDE